MITAVFDANIFISFLVHSSRTIRQLILLWKEKKIEVICSQEIKSEIYRVCYYPKITKYIKPQEFTAIKYLLEYQVKIINPKRRVIICKDKFDNIYLECCLEGKTDFLITGDKKHLLPLKKFKKTRIVSPKEFIELWKQD